MNEELRNLLYRSFDGELSPEEKKKLEAALERFEELKEEKAQISELRRDISIEPKPAFAPSFSDRVMQKIEHLPGVNQSVGGIFESLLAVFRPIAIAAILVCLIFMGLNMFKENKVSIKGAFAVSQSEATIEDAFEPTIDLTLEY